VLKPRGYNIFGASSFLNVLCSPRICVLRGVLFLAEPVFRTAVHHAVTEAEAVVVHSLFSFCSK